MKKTFAMALVSLMMALAITGCSSKPSTDELKQLVDFVLRERMTVEFLDRIPFFYNFSEFHCALACASI